MKYFTEIIDNGGLYQSMLEFIGRTYYKEVLCMKQDTLIKGLVESLKLSTAHTFDIHVGMFKDAGTMCLGKIHHNQLLIP